MVFKQNRMKISYCAFHNIKQKLCVSVTLCQEREKEYFLTCIMFWQNKKLIERLV